MSVGGMSGDKAQRSQRYINEIYERMYHVHVLQLKQLYGIRDL